MKSKLESGASTTGILAAGLVAVLTLTGCVTSHVLVGEKRPAIPPEQVHLYIHAPAKYDEIALVNSSSYASFALTAQGRSDAVLERLKKEAASLGANGILLQGVSDQQTGSISSGWASAGGVSSKNPYAFGLGASSATFQKWGSGMAIYVPADAMAAR